jgi:hypothetical protein
VPTVAELRAAAPFVLCDPEVDGCGAAVLKPCILLTGPNAGKPRPESYGPHAPRLRAAAVWLSRQPEVDALTAKLDAHDTALEQANDATEAALGQVRDARQEVAEARALLASIQVTVTGLRSQVATLEACEAAHPDSVPATPAAVPDRGPVAFDDIAALRASGLFRIPASANLVRVTDGTVLNDLAIGAHDLLVIDKDATVYYDASLGFMATGVGYVRGPNNTLLPINSKRGGKTINQWFAMLRVQAGIIGLGPTSRLAPTPTTWRQAAQIPDHEGTDPGRLWYDASKVFKGELQGSAEKLIESSVVGAYFANFDLVGPGDLGGVAYNGISLNNGGIVERVDVAGAWRGFAAVPNGETGAVTVGKGTYLISRLIADGRDATGKRVGSSPIMVNNSSGGRLEHVTMMCSVKGMPTIWRSSGKHEWVDVDSLWTDAQAVNLEECQPGMEFTWTGGRCWPNRNNTGGHPAPDGLPSHGMHIGLDARGAVKITLTDVDLDTNADPGKLCIQGYGGTTANKAKVTVIATQSGTPVPYHLYA